jgi:hypothetical protein
MRLVPLPTVAKPYKGLASLAGPAGGLATAYTTLAGSVPATAAAGTILALVPETPAKFGAANRRIEEQREKLSLFGYTQLAYQERSFLSWS